MATTDWQTDHSKFFTAVEQTADAVFITDPDGTIRYVNPAFEEITGFEKAEVLGEKPSIIKSGLHDNEFYKRLWGTVLSGNTFRETVINKKKNGELFYSDHTITPLKNKSGEIIAFIGIWKDITEKVLMEKRKDEFISIASHEFKTPITNIKILADLLKRKTKKEDQSEMIAKMHRQIDKLTRLVNDLLDVSRIQAGKLDLRFESFFLNELIDEEIASFKISHAQRQIQVQHNPKLKIKADPERLGEVISNLLENAIKYSPSDKPIWVKVQKDKSKIIVSIRDFGQGIPAEYRHMIFARFFQLNKDPVDLNSGLGLGLYIASEIIKLHGGKMWVESYQEKGSTFYFSIPHK